MYKTLELTLDTERTNNTKTNAQNFLVNTNDYDSVKIIADIVQDKERVDLSDATVKLAIRKPDQTIVFQDGTVTAAIEGECEFVLETQSYVLKGTHVAEVMIYFLDGKIVVTRAFAYHVAEGILSDTAIESTSWYQDVNELQVAVQELQVEVDAFIATAVEETRAEITEVDQRLTSQLADKVSQAEALTLLGGISEGTPLFAPDTAGMTDTTRNYVNTTDGLLYTHNGTSWVSTGVAYQATGIASGSIDLEKLDAQEFDLEQPETRSITNILVNGDFATPWAVVDGTHTVAANVGKFTATAASGRIQTAIDNVTGHKYYLRAQIKTTSNQVGLRFAGTGLLMAQGTGAFETVSGIIDGIVTATTTLRLQDLRTSAWTETEVKEVMVVDLTATYGAGNEPTKSEFDTVMASVNGGAWFSGTVTQKLVLAEERILLYDGLKIKSVAPVYQNKPLAGKKIVRFGDSTLEFKSGITAFAEKTGAEVVNVGVGGTRMSNHPTPGYNAFSMTKLADAIATGDWSQQIAEQNVAVGDDNTAVVSRMTAVNWSEVDIITINHGTNDFASNIPLGVASDYGNTTLFGAINYVVDKIQTAYPHIQIVFMTPTWRWYDDPGEDADVTPNPGGNYLVQFIDTIIAGAEKNKIPVLDLYRTSGINKYTAALYIPPGQEVHLSESGYIHVDNREAAFLNATL